MTDTVSEGTAGLVDGVSVVVPVFNSDETLTTLVERVRTVLADVAHEVILVDDGSVHATWRRIRKLAEAEPGVVGLRLGRNFGQHNALVAGVRAARYSVAVTLDDDLQNPPEEVPRLVATLTTEDIDVVYGTSPSVAQDRWRRLSSSLTRWLIASTLGAENARHMTSFRAFRTELRDAFAGEVGPSVSLDALLAWGTSRFGHVEVAHRPRENGRSGYTFRRLVRFAVDTATGYSTRPLQVATTVGLLTAAFGLGVLAWVVANALTGTREVPGFAFLASTITIFAGVQLITLGIMGEYLARMHFRLMRKPTYVVRERIPRGETESLD